MSVPEYDELVRRVDALAAQIALRRAGDLACGRGCTACCRVQLSLSPVEADEVRAALAGLSEDTRERLRARARELAAGGDLPRDTACVMLDEDGGCAIYASRPLVCRTQGHALRYPAGSLPDDSVFATGGGGEITWCPLNYTAELPRSEDVLEAERIDEVLATINLLAAEGTRDVLERATLVELALAEDEPPQG
jgi:Fe-S-cluster containining protein